MPKPNQTSTTKKMLERSIFLNMTSFVEVEIGQEAVLECRVDNVVSKYLVSMLEIINCTIQCCATWSGYISKRSPPPHTTRIDYFFRLHQYEESNFV